MNKKRIKKYISWVCIVAIVALLAVMPLMASGSEAADGPQASVLTASAKLGDIDSRIIGGGTLSGEDAVEVTIPASVKLTAFLVGNGDRVSKGDVIASVDRVSVMAAIAQVQATLDILAEEIEEASGDVTADQVAAQAGGIVKILYAQEGDDVKDVMLEHGALAVLSLDGLMEVRIERGTDLKTGDSVCVILSDGTEVTGRVESNYDGTLTVTISDEGYTVGETVRVTGEDGERIGTGVLAIHSPWNAVAYAGKVADIKVSEGKTVTAGATLMTLEDTGYTAQYRQLSAQHREYEALMLELFVMYQTETITAPCDGVISGMDENNANLLSNNGGNWCLELLVNAPNGDDETSYINYIGQVTAVGIDGLILKMNPQQLEITDYKDLNGSFLDTEYMTGEVIYSDDAPVYQLVDGEWTRIEAAEIGEGDILLFAGDENGEFVWVVRVSEGGAGEERPEDPEGTGGPADPTESTDPAEGSEATEPSEPKDEETESIIPGDGETDTSSQGNGNGTGQQSGGDPQTGGDMSGFAGGTQEEAEVQLYSLDTLLIASVLPQDTITLEITVDELDVGGLTIGQTAEVTLDALSGRFFTAVVSGIGASGTSEGGNSKFTVELTMVREEDMLPGMNATAYVTLDTAAQILTVPVAALQDNGAETLVYTSYDEESGEFGGAVAVTVGVSDGENAQILSGIQEGCIIYYPYYDTLVVSDSVESGSFGFGSFGGFGGIGSGRGGR